MAISAQDYKFYKSLDPSELTDEERKDLDDYERAEAKAPSREEAQWARDIDKMASRNPSTLGRELKESGDYERAQQILNAERAYVATLGPRKMDAYVQPVRRIPDNLLEDNDFKFNWKSAYENVKGEKLRDTEADYDKLQKFIQSNMYDVEDPANLHEIAYRLHMFKPNEGQTWSEFMNSEQGTEFKNYMKDVEKYQRNKTIDDIFSGKEPTKVNYPLLGPTDIPGSNFLVDFGLPVSKQSAMESLKKGEEPNLLGPMATDFGTNILMAVQPGAKSSVPFINKGSNFLAPAVQNFGNYLYNDEDPAAASIKTVMGGAVNIGTPYALHRFNKYTRMPGQEYSQRVLAGERIDQLADKLSKIEKRIENGALVKSVKKVEDASGKTAKGLYFYNNSKKKVFTDSEAIKEIMEKQGYSVSPLKDMRSWKAGILSNKDHDFYYANSSILRKPFDKTEKEVEKSVYDDAYLDKLDARYHKVAAQQARGKDISQMDKNDIEAILRGPAHETYMNWLARKSPEALKNYLTNMAGRTQMGTGVLSLPQMIFQTNFGKMVEEHKKKKPRISEIFGE